MKGSPKILVTNDDGIDSPGLVLLARELANIGEVFVVAPAHEMSGSSHALPLDTALPYRIIDDHTVAIEGTPVACVKYALLSLFQGEIGKPDLLVSGVNRGANLGDDIAYSGTLGAAWEGALGGIPSMAVSVASRQPLSSTEMLPFVAGLARLVMERGLPHRVFLNVNIPDVRYEEIAGIVWTRQGKRIYHDCIVLGEGANGDRLMKISMTREAGGDDVEGTDLHAVARRMISITPLAADLTAHDTFPAFQSWPVSKIP